MALQRLMEVLQKGDEVYHAPVLDILIAIFKVPSTSTDCLLPLQTFQPREPETMKEDIMCMQG